MYWPWWASAIALAMIGFTYYRVTGLRLGVSGLLARVSAWRAERKKERTEAAALANAAALEAALQAATRKAFGDKAPAAAESTAPADSTEAASAPADKRAFVPVSAALVFMLMLVIGGIGGAFARTGNWQIQYSLGPAWEHFFGSGAAAWAVLFGGGLLVGVGTRLANGCTSGHGLSGCSRLQPASLVATAAFFGAGVGVSFLLAALWGAL